MTIYSSLRCTYESQEYPQQSPDENFRNPKWACEDYKQIADAPLKNCTGIGLRVSTSFPAFESYSTARVFQCHGNIPHQTPEMLRRNGCLSFRPVLRICVVKLSKQMRVDYQQELHKTYISVRFVGDGRSGQFAQGLINGCQRFYGCWQKCAFKLSMNHFQNLVPCQHHPLYAYSPP